MKDQSFLKEYSLCLKLVYQRKLYCEATKLLWALIYVQGERCVSKTSGKSHWHTRRRLARSFYVIFVSFWRWQQKKKHQFVQYFFKIGYLNPIAGQVFSDLPQDSFSCRSDYSYLLPELDATVCVLVLPREGAVLGAGSMSFDSKHAIWGLYWCILL